MKPFDLEKALAGEPVKLRDGSKAYVRYVVPDEHLRGGDDDHKLQGYAVDDGKFDEWYCWDISGKYFSDSTSEFDIIEMWQEPRPRVQLDLPAPLKEPREGM